MKNMDIDDLEQLKTIFEKKAAEHKRLSLTARSIENSIESNALFAAYKDAEFIVWEFMQFKKYELKREEDEAKRE